MAWSAAASSPSWGRGDRGNYFYLIEGSPALNSEKLSAGDAAKVTEVAELRMCANEAYELIFVDVPMVFEAVGMWKGRI